MVEIFVADSGRARSDSATKEVRLDFENSALEEITIQLPFANLQALVRQAAEQLGISVPKETTGDPLPLGEMYRVTSHTTARTQSGVRLTIQIESETGVRLVDVDFSPQAASLLADDLYEKAAP